MSAPAMKEVTYRIRRFDPNQDAAPHWEEYRIPYAAGMTVLDGLWKIKETLSPTLVWRSSCRMGVCGSCGMLINGRPRLACNTQITELESTSVVVAPLPNFDIVRDLVPELGPMFGSHQDLQPFLIRADVEEREHPTGEFVQSAHELEEYLQFTYCIKCGCCMAACPTFATDALYSGPMPLGQAHRYNADSRDGGFETRKQVLAGEAGPWRCHYAGECSRVCPKGVDPAKAIQLMKRELVFDYLGLHKTKCPAKVAAKPTEGKRRDGIPEAPARTV
ncbi:MAG: succinate dehydrogenase/fumarate reductase iron-sulfur subunit [Thermoanaerobaculales bacterium]